MGRSRKIEKLEIGGRSFLNGPFKGGRAPQAMAYEKPEMFPEFEVPYHSVLCVITVGIFRFIISVCGKPASVG